MKVLRFILLVSLFTSIGIIPTEAQTITYTGTCADGKDNNFNMLIDDGDPSCRAYKGFCEVMTPTCQRQLNAAASSQTVGTYNPNIQVGSNNSTFGGFSLNGVGSSILSCTNAGKKVVGGIKNVFNTKPKLPGAASLVAKSVPTRDEQARKELETLNNTQQCLDGIAYSVAKNLLQQVTTKTLRWVTTGFQGTPLYVRDQSSYLKSIEKQQLKSFLANTNNNTSLFGDALRSALTQEITGNPVAFNTQNNTSPKAQEYNRFLTDFTDGGWSAWLGTTQNDNNNPIGAFFKAVDTASDRANLATSLVTQQINRNGGFLDLRKCVEYSTRANITASGEPTCLQWETTTPGSTIASQVSTVLNSPTRQLEAADEINEVFGSFFDTVLNSLFSQGLSSLRGRNGGDFSDAGGGLGNNVVIGSNGEALNGYSADGFGYALEGSGYGSNQFDISRPQQLRGVIQAQYNFINRAMDSRMAMNRLVPRIGELDYCLPGPNPTWPTYLNENGDSLITALREKYPTALNIGIGNLTPRVNNFDTQGFSPLDKTDDEQKTVTHSYRVHDNPKVADLLNFLEVNFGNLATQFQTTYSIEALADTFASTGATVADQTYLRGFARNAYSKAGDLIGYDQATVEMNGEYDVAVANTQDAIVELEDIRAEVESIVSVAKARYIAQRSAAGNPVNMACINEAYQIDTSEIKGVVRKESDVPSPIITQSRNAAIYFYNNL